MDVAAAIDRLPRSRNELFSRVEATGREKLKNGKKEEYRVGWSKENIVGDTARAAPVQQRNNKGRNGQRYCAGH